VADVQRVDAVTYRISLADDVSASSQLAVFGADYWALVAPGIIEIALGTSRDFSLLVLSTEFGATNVSGGGPVPPPAVGFDDLGDVSGAVLLDGATASAWKMRLVGDVAFTFANLTAGRSYALQIEQDGVGNWSVTYPGGSEFADFDPGIPQNTPTVTTRVDALARSSTAVTLSASGGINASVVSEEFAGIDEAAETILRGGFSVGSDPTSRFLDLAIWQGPCTGAGPSQSGPLYFTSAAGTTDVTAIFRAAGAGPVAADLWEWVCTVGWSVQVPGTAGKEFTVKAGATTRIVVDSNGVDVNGSRVTWQHVTTSPDTAMLGRWVYVDAGGAVLNLPAGSAAIDGHVITVTNRSGGAASVVPDGAQTINGAPSYAMADKLTTSFAWFEAGPFWNATPGA
jgi:hypothetical protein